MPVPAIMLQGTGSSVGKSLLVAGIGRALRRRGWRVAPFKPQNMSNNAAVAADGGEIGRAQALQARACGLPASRHMNPVLLKPDGEAGGAQLVVQGRVEGRAGAREYQGIKPRLMARVRDSFARVSAGCDLVLVEGAGSASEINLRPNDIANMGFARAENLPVVIVGDIDRGGVIASLVGTRHVLDDADGALVRGFVVNRMRGDATLFADGMRLIAARTGWPSFGLVPFFPELGILPREDALDLVATPSGGRDGVDGGSGDGAGNRRRFRVVAPLLPHLANADDFDPLGAEPDVELVFADLAEPMPPCDLLVLGGSKAVIADLGALRAQGWDHDIHAHRRRGGRVLGLCGGYQMLGTSVADPDGIEGIAGEVPGLGLLDVRTVLGRDKRLRAERAGFSVADGVALRGYEIHLGATTGADATARPFARLVDGDARHGPSPGGTPDGARSPDGRVAGTYLHGLFAVDAQRGRWLGDAAAPAHRHEHRVDAVLDGWADHLERCLDLDAIVRAACGR